MLLQFIISVDLRVDLEAQHHHEERGTGGGGDSPPRPWPPSGELSVLWVPTALVLPCHTPVTGACCPPCRPPHLCLQEGRMGSLQFTPVYSARPRAWHPGGRWWDQVWHWSWIRRKERPRKISTISISTLLNAYWVLGTVKQTQHKAPPPWSLHRTERDGR